MSRDANAIMSEIVEHAKQTAANPPTDRDCPPPAFEGRKTTAANLVLEGGAMRSLFTAGVLDVFMERGLFCDRAIGVSAGALTGYNYVAGAIGRSCYINLAYCADKRYLSMASFAATGDVYGRSFAFDEIPNALERFDYRAFDESPMKLVAVSSNIETGEADYHELENAEDGLPYLVATSSMPLVSHIVEVDGKKLLDGGTCDSVPILYSMLARPGKHIVVRTQHPDYRKKPNKLMALMRQRYGSYPYFLDRVQTRHIDYNRMCRALPSLHEEGAAFVIAPPAPVEVSNIEHDQAKLLALYEQGVAEAVRVWPDLERYLAS